MNKKEFNCPKCGSDHTVKHGFVVLKSGRKRRRKCQECGQTFYEDKGGNK